MREFVSQDVEVTRLDEQAFYHICQEAFRKGAELYTDGDESRIELRISRNEHGSYIIDLFDGVVNVHHSLFVGKFED